MCSIFTESGFTNIDSRCHVCGLCLSPEFHAVGCRRFPTPTRPPAFLQLKGCCGRSGWGYPKQFTVCTGWCFALSSISLGSLSVLPNGEQQTVYCWGSECCRKCAQFVSHLALSFTLAGVLCPPRWAFPKQFTVGVVNAVLSVSALFGVYGGVIFLLGNF